MDDEAIAAITRKQTAEIQTAMKLSSMARTVSMLIVLVIAFITGWFSPIATAIPMLALRPILMVAELIKSKNNPKPDPSKFIKYEDEDENTEEKEDN
jgi:xanthine/uracil/vitamin C permease (AzgA family)